jgi:hypothetical protein
MACTLAAFDFADLGAKRRRSLQAGVVDGPWERAGAPHGADRPPPHPFFHTPDAIARPGAPQVA